MGAHHSDGTSPRNPPLYEDSTLVVEALGRNYVFVTCDDSEEKSYIIDEEGMKELARLSLDDDDFDSALSKLNGSLRGKIGNGQSSIRIFRQKLNRAYNSMLERMGDKSEIYWRMEESAFLMFH